ncbi:MULTISPECIES: TetR/AcrR family transcriptional regulator [unclassified Nocardioides]|uniref:TetR/AcrR family transcriptional regulator n=1 Tax=unclassified Nocardioides TaxID=2615069 RepID=UPI001CEDF75D|nr:MULTISPECIES: TetR/AcrR family transcriptional regulator [unclassified Nocardioides]
MATPTREKLLDACLRVVVDQGIAKASARAIATEAGVNQALVFYHFGSVDELLAAACDHGARQRIEAHRAALAEVTDFSGLIAVARAIHAHEQDAGNVALLGQLLAGSSSHASLGPATAAGLALWATEVQVVLERLLGSGPLAGLVDVPGLARAVSASFVGLELYDGVDPEGAASAFAAFEQLARLLGVVDGLGPVERAALRRRLRRSTG